jgi:hypothetical protein
MWNSAGVGGTVHLPCSPDRRCANRSNTNTSVDACTIGSGAETIGFPIGLANIRNIRECTVRRECDSADLYDEALTGTSA